MIHYEVDEDDLIRLHFGHLHNQTEHETMTLDHQEVEWQFDAADLSIVEQWLLANPAITGISIGPVSKQRLVDVYFDTEDWRIHRAGYALRVRHTGKRSEATLKSLAAGRNGLRNRREISEDLQGKPDETLETLETLRQAPGPAGQRVRALIGTHALRQLFEVHTQRRTFKLHMNGNLAGEVTLDQTRIPGCGPGSDRSLQRVEIEIDESSVAALRSFVKTLRKACDLQPATDSKYETGLAAQGLTPFTGHDLGPTETDDKSSIGELALARLREYLAAFLDREPGVRLGDDSDDIHDMRVATRRLRAAIRMFADYLPPQMVPLREQLGWIASTLGAVRDLDVQIERVNVFQPPTGAAELQTVVRLLLEARGSAHQRLLEALDSSQYEQFIATFVTVLRVPLEMPEDGAVPALAVVPRLIRRRYRKLRRAGDELTADSPPADYHALRIQCKRLRYGLEFVPQYRKSARKFLKQLAELQDILGAYQDVQVADAQLRALSADHSRDLSPQAIFTLGEMAQRLSQQGEEAKAHFPAAYAVIKKSFRRFAQRTPARRR
ncbi:MAG: CHAD domain-containing protein [Chloroflexi bacterium]|nr:CHAD domain-containing protein [Chloroflexota bacterium]